MLYEFAGIFTNLFGGILASRRGLKSTACIGLGLMTVSVVLAAPVQVIFSSHGSAANSSLAGNVSSRDDIAGDNTLASSDAAPIRFRYMIYICFVQGLAGVGKDLMKVSGKSITKLVNKSSDNGGLFKMVVYITGAKNTVKGVGYLMGGVVLLLGYWQGVCLIAAIVFAAIPPVLWYVDQGLAVSKRPPSVRDVFSNISRNVGMLSAARFWLFGSRDVWFEIAAPLFLKEVVQWPGSAVSATMGIYIIIYGFFKDIRGKFVDVLPRIRAVSLHGRSFLHSFVSLQVLFVAVHGD